MSAGQPFAFPEIYPGCECVICRRLGLDPKAKIARPIFHSFQIARTERGNVEIPLQGEQLEQVLNSVPNLREWDLPVEQRVWHISLVKLVKQIVKDTKNALPFMQPVDPKALNIPDYFKVIRHPMDLTTVMTRLGMPTDGKDELRYDHPLQCISDLRLIFRNAFAYNKPTSYVWIVAEKLSRKFELDLIKISGAMLT